MGENIPPADNRIPIAPQMPPLAPLRRNKLTQATEFLQDNSRTGTLRTSYDKHRRYVELSLSTLFTNLVTLYVPLIQSHWQKIKRYMDQFTPPGQTTAQTYAARLYISAWIHDLYVSNREAVRKLSPLAFSEHYQQDAAYYSYEYDGFLVALNAAIRPTNIRGIAEDVLYIPILTNNPNWTSTENPFRITNMSLDYDKFSGLIDVIRYSKIWEFQPLVTDTIGRPSWLFDWHTDNRCCAWFPMEGNYNMDDVTIAYVIGAACSPKLGYRDPDDWQDFPGGNQPAEIIVTQYQRVNARSFYGGYEVRTIDTRQQTSTFTSTLPTQGRGKRTRTAKDKQPAALTTTSTGNEPAETTDDTEEVTVQVAQYRIIDWIYYHLLVLNLDPHTRSGALKMIIGM